MDQNGQDNPENLENPEVKEDSSTPIAMMELGEMVVVEQPGHPYNRRTGKVIGRRGEYAPGDPWLMVLVDIERRCFLFPQSMLRLQKKD